MVAANALLQRSADGAYPFTQDSNFWYLSGLTEPGLVLVIENDKEYLIAPKANQIKDTFEGAFDFNAARQISGVSDVVTYEEGWKRLDKRIKKVKHIAMVKPPERYIEQLQMFTNPAKAALVQRLMLINPELKLIDIRGHLTRLRSLKTTEEIDAIKRAISETRRLFTAMNKVYKTAANEADVMAEITKLVIKRHTEFAYEPIIASGKNALILHYTANAAAIDQNLPLLLDVGAKVGGYAADVTRTVCPFPSKRTQKVYQAVKSVQQYALELIKPGAILSACEVQVQQFMGEKLRELGLIKSISQASVREFYPHATSHFVGIDTHDPGDYSAPLAEGMVLTVEPGIYIPSENIGIRLEDTVLVVKRGHKNLSASIPMEIDRLA